MTRLLPCITALLCMLAAACGDQGAPTATAHPEVPESSAEGAHDHDAEPGAHEAEHGDHNAGHGAHAAERTRIDADIAQEAGIRVAAAGPGTIADEHVVQGLVTPVDGRTATVGARFPGVVRAMPARAGDRVRAGQVLAIIESNLSLSDYEVKSPLDGTVLAQLASPGAVVAEGAPLYEVADLSTLWVDLHVFGSDAGHFRAGMPVHVSRLADQASARTHIDRVMPSIATASQSTIARASVPNPDGLWRPGAAVQARITVDQMPAEIVVPLTALQTYEGRETVFVQHGDEYEARAIETGRRDARQVQVLAGVQPGERVVVEQSYLIKADLEKAGALHAH